MTRYRVKITTSYKIMCVAALLVLILLLIPMIKVGTCMVMTGDDYSFSTGTHQAIQNGTSVIAAAAEKTKEVYYSWQGSFSAVFLMTLQPGIFGYNYYWLTTVIMLLSLLGGIFYFCIKFFRDIFGNNILGAIFVAAVISVFATQFLPLAYQSFYWYNGSVYYTFFFGLVLFAAGLCVAYIKDGKVFCLILAAILSFVIGGGNYITALLSALLLLLTVFALALKKNKKYRVILVVFLVLMVAMTISVTAPGNAVRQSENPDHPGAILAVLASLRYAVHYIKMWANLPFFAMVLILCPVLWDMAGKSRKKFSLPGLFSIVSYLLFSSMFCPHTYAMGSPGPGRILNIIYFAFLIFTTLNLYWWMGWIQKKKKCERDNSLLIRETIAAVLAVGLIVVALKSTTNRPIITSVSAFNEIRNGTAEGYYRENEERFALLEDKTLKEVTLKALENTPYLLFSEDMKEDPEFYMNRDAATYFNKNSVSVK